MIFSPLQQSKVRRTHSDTYALESFVPSNLSRRSSSDFETGNYALPHLESGKDSLKRITPETLVRVMNGEFEQRFEKVFIVDCRFEYEYLGGHVRGALNVNTFDQLERAFLANPLVDKSTLIVFHCEFSSKRAPRMAHHLRSLDRQQNVQNYPSLFYPEIYILEGGYRNFFLCYKVRSCGLFVSKRFLTTSV